MTPDNQTTSLQIKMNTRKAAIDEVAAPSGTCKRLCKQLALLAMLILCGPAYSLGWIGNDLNGIPCQGNKQGFGPYNYTDPQLQKRVYGEPLEIVERFHFTPEVEQLVKGANGPLPTDIDYTLRAFPNHHRALWAIIKFHLDERRKKPRRYTPAECYLQRALVFSPNDGIVQMLFGIYLHKAGHMEAAGKYFDKALAINPDNAEAHYNYGLLLVDKEKYDEAIEHARTAYQLGYPLPGLGSILKEKGYEIAQEEK